MELPQKLREFQIMVLYYQHKSKIDINLVFQIVSDIRNHILKKYNGTLSVYELTEKCIEYIDYLIDNKSKEP